MSSFKIIRKLESIQNLFNAIKVDLKEIDSLNTTSDINSNHIDDISIKALCMVIELNIDSVSDLTIKKIKSLRQNKSNHLEVLKSAAKMNIRIYHVGKWVLPKFDTMNLIGKLSIQVVASGRIIEDVDISELTLN